MTAQELSEQADIKYWTLDHPEYRHLNIAARHDGHQLNQFNEHHVA
jgi:hypothetical protein